MSAEPLPRRRRWLIAVLVGWGVLVAGAAIVSARVGAPTAREQTSVLQATPIVERAVTDLLAAAGDAVASVGPYTRTGACRITAVRGGERWERVVAFYTPAGAEPALLDRLARSLPASYRAVTRRGESRATRSLRADAGDFVGVSGGVTGAGEVRLTVATGCRTRPAPATSSSGAPAPADRAAVTAVFDALRIRPVDWRLDALQCADGGAVEVVRARSDPGVMLAPLQTALATVGPNPVVAQPGVYAYRAGAASVVARVDAERVTVAATTPCA